MVRYTEPFLLSSRGSTRGTAYSATSKSVTIDGKTHVVWLDAVASVRARTYDHATGEWSETYAVGDGCDNHTSPTLTVDRDRHLRIAYGPHGFWGGWNQARFKWLRATQPNSAAAWEKEADFGYGATYACMAHTPQGFDTIAYRGGEHPPAAMFQRQREQGGWTTAQPIFRQEISPQYTHVGATVACDPGGTLYFAAHFYNDAGEYNGPAALQRSHAVGIVKSSDLGHTWQDLRGEPVTVPTVLENRIEVPSAGEDVRMKGLAIDSANSLWALTCDVRGGAHKPLLSRWAGDRWETVDLRPFVPEEQIIVDAVLTIDARDRLHVAFTGIPVATLDDRAVGRTFGRETSEVFHLVGELEAKDFTCAMVSAPDETTANWLPNISRGGINQVVENPVILYTHGSKGDGCSPETETEIYCVMTS